MRYFVEGDIVKSNISFRNKLTKNKNYVVTAVYGSIVSIISDDGHDNSYSSDRFELNIPEMRNEVIDDILK